MNQSILEPVITIAAGIIGVAIIAVLVSQRSNTAGVLSSAGGAFANALSAAVSPVTGNSAAPNVNAGSNSNGLLGGANGLLMGGGTPLSLNLAG